MTEIHLNIAIAKNIQDTNSEFCTFINALLSRKRVDLYAFISEPFTVYDKYIKMKNYPRFYRAFDHFDIFS